MTYLVKRAKIYQEGYKPIGEMKWYATVELPEGAIIITLEKDTIVFLEPLPSR